MSTIVRPRSTKKYQTLRTLGYTDEQAIAALTELGVIEPEPLPEFPVIAKLVESGDFTDDEIATIMARLNSDEPTHPVAAPAPVALTPKQQAEALVTASPFGYTKGRVYITTDMLADFARVFKTGTPEIVKSSAVGHVPAVLVYREESGDLAVQNLKEEQS